MREYLILTKIECTNGLENLHTYHLNKLEGNHGISVADLYQAGIVFYELLCHHKKNFGANEQEARIIAANPPLLNQLYIPSFFNEFITKILHIDIEQRWQSARECLNELKNIIRKTPKTEPD